MTKKLSLFLFVVSTLFGFYIAAGEIGEPGCINEARALLRNSENAKSFYLGKRVTPSHLNYWDLALAIEKRFEEFEYVEVLSIKNSFDNLMNKLPPRDDYEALNLKLRFKAVMGVDSLNFRCKMTVSINFISSPNGVGILIDECKNSQGIILDYFFIYDLLSPKIRKIKAKNP